MDSKKRQIKLFGTDGIRGRANCFPMTVEIALALGKALACHLRKQNKENRVVLGKDTRLSCYMFENALIAGLNANGVDTLMVGPLPTPGVAFITKAYRADAGIVISASHNPFYDNGIKIFSAEGYKLPDLIEETLEKMIYENAFGELPGEDGLGRNTRIADADGRYIEFVKATFLKGKSLKGLKILLDCANGAAHRVAPLVFHELDAEVFVIGNEPNGLNINAGCGALYPAQLKKLVKASTGSIGVALDGDGDRVVMIDEQGHIVDGDVMLGICAHHLKNYGKLKNDRIVGTVMTNFGVVRYLERLGIEVFLSRVGDRYVLEDMLTHKAYVGGEQSGHIIFLDYNSTGDGIVSALQILKIMAETETTLAELARSIPRFPQILLNVPVANKTPIENLSSVQSAIDDAEQKLGAEGRVLVRYSGTQNLCRILVEGAKKQTLEPLAKRIAQALAQEIGENRK